MKIKADSMDARVTFSGDLEVTFKVPRNARAMVEETIRELQGKPVSVEVKQWREKRSLEANAYAWVLIDRIAEVLRQGRTEVYRRYIKDVPGNSHTICVKTEAAESLVKGWEHNGLGWLADTLPSKLPNCTNVILYDGSSTFDSKQMSVMIDLIVQDAKALGIETLTPSELERIKEDYEQHHSK